MTTRHSVDLCVIGAGSGGLSVASAAAQLGARVVLIEKGSMGGDCLNHGCVPSKALIAAARHAHLIGAGAPFGIGAAEAKVDFKAVHEHVRSVIAAIAPNDSVERFTGLGVTVLLEAASFTNGSTVIAGNHEVKARRFVIATGSSPAIPPIEGLDGVPFLTNETVFDLVKLPRHLIVVGAGPVGMELAQAHRRLGAQVTVVDMGQPLAKDDPELARVALEAVRREGVVVRAPVTVVRVSTFRAGVRVEIADNGATEKIDGSHLLIATGRSANVDGLGLDAAGISYSGRGIKTDSGLRTTNRRVYAIGDVAGGPQFTHAANYHAGLVVRSALFRQPIRVKPALVPRVTFTDPEIAHVGLGEDEARQEHTDIRVLRWPFHENDRAQTERCTEGLVKVVTSRKGHILGASIVGAHAGELIHPWALAISSRLKIKSMTGYIAPYPTLGEVNKRAAYGYYTSSLGNPWLRRTVRFLARLG